MSWHYLVTAQTSSVYITHHAAALNAIAICVKQLMISLQQCYWEIGSFIHGGGGGRLVTKGENSIAVCGFGCRKSLNGPGKQSSHLTGPPCSVQMQFIG